MKSLKNKSTNARSRSAFTLVEMLVATALVVLIMFLFAQVFGMATNSMSKMRGMAELDQGARTITTVLTNDIHNRTFRDVQPFWPGQTSAVAGYDPAARRQGYFYISENDPRYDFDDVLQLTINVGNNIERSGTPFARGESPAVAARRDPSQRDPVQYGKTVQLAEPFPDPDPTRINHVNQPDFDDGTGPIEVSPGVFTSASPDGLGMSQYAEVSYFLRNGNLYRRVLLVRQPYDSSWGEQPDGIMGQYDLPDTINGEGQFWRDFDYSAWFDEAVAPPTVKFSAAPSAMDNSWSAGGTIFGGIVIPVSLGVPHFRFGHTIFTNTGTSTGLPREFLDYATPATPSDWPFEATAPFAYLPTPPATNFIGRFTVNECSHDNFGYPGRIHVNTTSGARENPIDPQTALTFDNRYRVSEYANTNRRGDDLLMSNVHGFDVQVWDDVLNKFVDLGHDESVSGTPGRYHRSNNQNHAYGNRFDTWNPFASLSNAPYYPSSAPPAPTLQVGGPEERQLRAIRITIRYQDVSTGAMRSVVRDFPLMDPGQEYK